MSILMVYVFYFNVILLTSFYFFFFNDTATTEIYTLSLHDALPISLMFACSYGAAFGAIQHIPRIVPGLPQVVHLARAAQERSEEHTSELQSQSNLVCRLLLEKKKRQLLKNSRRIQHQRN